MMTEMTRSTKMSYKSENERERKTRRGGSNPLGPPQRKRTLLTVLGDEMLNRPQSSGRDATK